MQTTTKLNRTDLSSGKTHRVLLASAFTVMLTAAASVHVVGADKPHEPSSSTTKPAHAASAKANTNTNLVLLLQEEDFWVIEDEPVNHLARARQALDKPDAKIAAKELREAAFFVKAHAARAEGAAKLELKAAAARLENLAGRVEKGVVKSEDEPASALATTHLSLARYHYLAAVKEQARDDMRSAKRDMTKAADYVENHFKSAGAAIDQATQSLLADARKAGQSVESAAAKSEADTGRVLESLGRKIQELGRNLANNSKGERHEESTVTRNVAQHTQAKTQP
jgi:hypothetical protein